MTRLDSAIAQANAEVAEMVGSIGARRRYTVSKFGIHPDGYPHARVIVDGRPFYFHCRFGSWQAPGRARNIEVHKEPEALLGSALGREVKYTLAEMTRRAMRRREERDDSRQPEDTGGVRPTGNADRLQPAGDGDGPDGQMEPDGEPGEGHAGEGV